VSVHPPLCFLIVLVVGTFFWGCKQEEKSLNGITGTVMIDGAPGAEVTVELFEEPSLDSSTVWYYTARNQAVGFRYSPEAAFDWRRDRRTFLSGQATGSDGKFQFDGLADNDYIIIARKRYEIGGITYWAWTLPHIVSLRGAALDAGNVELSEPTIVPRTPLSGAVTWAGAGHTYILSGDLNIPVGSSLTIDPGAVVQLPFNGRVLISGQLTARGNADEYISFTSLADEPFAGDWRYIWCLAGADAPVFEYCRFDYADVGARVEHTAGATFDYCYFSNLAVQGLSFVGDLNGELVTVTRSVFTGTSVGADIYGAQSVTIAHSMFFSEKTYALRIQRVRGGEVFCNWFQDCGRFDTSASGEHSGVLYLSDVQQFDVHFCHSLESAFANDIGSKVDSTVKIQHNTYQSINRVLNIGVTEQNLGPSNPRFNFNSMISIDKINVIVHSCQNNYRDVDCTNNFWNLESPEDVRRFMVQDCSLSEDSIRSFVHVEPILLQAPADAGICTTNE
jgi:hypothetical protein